MDGLSGLFVSGEGVEGRGGGGGVVLRDAGLGAVERGIRSAVEGVKGGVARARVLLVLDGLDLLLAATAAGAVEVGDLVAELREVRRAFLPVFFLLDAYGFGRKRTRVLMVVGV